MNENLQNALAFYRPAPPGWFSGTQAKVEASGLWLWETLQGDFHDDPSTAQVVTGTLISMIPLVDQLCDVRDFIANCRKIDEDSSDTWAWVAMALTLMGAVPVLGSLAKGCFKVLIQASRRSFHRAFKSTERSSGIDKGMILLGRYLGIEVVRKTLARMNVYNPYQYMADQIDTLRGRLNVALLMEGFDALKDAAGGLLETVKRWAPAWSKEPVDELLAIIEAVSIKAPAEIKKAMALTLDYLDALTNRLRVEGDNLYRARPGNNIHVLGNRQSAELELLERNKPEWVDKVDKATKPAYAAVSELSKDAVKKIARGWPDIRATSEHLALKGKFTTFDESIKDFEVNPGTRLYRVLDPNSNDNSICWMLESDFKALTSKNQWRREYAVWKHWNENGEYVVYTVPPNQPLKAWKGRTATQEFKPDSSYHLEGGRPQIVLNPDELDPKFLRARQATGWGYDDGTGIPDLDPAKPFLGLPDLTHKWYVPVPKKEP